MEVRLPVERLLYVFTGTRPQTLRLCHCVNATFLWSSSTQSSTLALPRLPLILTARELVSFAVQSRLSSRVPRGSSECPAEDHGRDGAARRSTEPDDRSDYEVGRRADHGDKPRTMH